MRIKSDLMVTLSSKIIHVSLIAYTPQKNYINVYILINGYFLLFYYYFLKKENKEEQKTIIE